MSWILYENQHGSTTQAISNQPVVSFVCHQMQHIGSAIFNFGNNFGNSWRGWVDLSATDSMAYNLYVGSSMS